MPWHAQAMPPALATPPLPQPSCRRRGVAHASASTAFCRARCVRPAAHTSHPAKAKFGRRLAALPCSAVASCFGFPSTARVRTRPATYDPAVLAPSPRRRPCSAPPYRAHSGWPRRGPGSQVPARVRALPMPGRSILASHGEPRRRSCTPPPRPRRACVACMRACVGTQAQAFALPLRRLSLARAAPPTRTSSRAATPPDLGCQAPSAHSLARPRTEPPPSRTRLTGPSPPSFFPRRRAEPARQGHVAAL